MRWNVTGRPTASPAVLWLPEPRRLLGNWGPWVCGVASDAPTELREAWLP
jgi:hypothetical protein